VSAPLVTDISGPHPTPPQLQCSRRPDAAQHQERGCSLHSPWPACTVCLACNALGTLPWPVSLMNGPRMGFHARRYGQRALVNENVGSLVNTLTLHKTSDLRLEAFARLLSEEWDVNIFLDFLGAQAMAVQVKARGVAVANCGATDMLRSCLGNWVGGWQARCCCAATQSSPTRRSSHGCLLLAAYCCIAPRHAARQSGVHRVPSGAWQGRAVRLGLPEQGGRSGRRDAGLQVAGTGACGEGGATPFC
jgi:hypothetical protein